MKIYWIAYEHNNFKLGHDKKQRIKSFCEENLHFYIYDSTKGVAGVGVQDYLVTPQVEDSIDRLAREFGIEKVKSTKRNTLIMAKNEAVKTIRYHISNSQYSLIYDFEKAVENFNVEGIIQGIDFKYNVVLDTTEVISAVKKLVESY